MSILREMQGWIGPRAVRLSARFNDHVRHSVLDNGITIVTQPRIINSKMNFHAIIPAGAHTDPAGKEGLSHFLEHVILPPGSGTSFAERSGYRNASTGSLNVEVYGEIENEDRPEEYILDFLKRAFCDPIDPYSFSMEQRRIMNEIGMCADDAQHAHAIMDSAFYSDGRFNENILGTKETVRGISIDDIESHRRKWFVGENIYLGVTGVKNHQLFVRKAEEILADIPKGKKYKILPPSYSPAEIRRNEKNVHQAYYSIHFPVPIISPDKRYALRMLDKIISFKINKNIIEGEGLVYAADTSVYTPAQRMGLFRLTANSLPEDAGSVMSSMVKTIQEIISGDFQKEWSVVKRDVKNELMESSIVFPIVPHRSEDMARNMMTLNRTMVMGDMDEYAKNITMQDIHGLARSIFLGPPSLTVYGNGENIPDLQTISRMLKEGVFIEKSPDEQRGFHL